MYLASAFAVILITNCTNFHKLISANLCNLWLINKYCRLVDFRSVNEIYGFLAYNGLFFILSRKCFLILGNDLLKYNFLLNNSKVKFISVLCTLGFIKKMIKVVLRR